MAKTQATPEALQKQIDELSAELQEIKEFLMHITTEAQTITFDECKIENVIIQQPAADITE